MSSYSLRSAIDGKCRDCGACDAGANWREHVSCCPIVDCSLWIVRPLSRSAPAWLSSRNVGTLPEGWRELPMHDAMAMLRNAPSNGPRDSNTLSRGDETVGNGAMGRNGTASPPCGPVAVMKGGASC